MVDELPQLRFQPDARAATATRSSLFHLALAPLLKVLPPLAARAGGAVAAGRRPVAALLAMLASRVLGGWGILFPFWLFFASTEWAWRLVRLRPELLALSRCCCWRFWAMAGPAGDSGRGAGGPVHAGAIPRSTPSLGLIFLVFVAYGWREASGAPSAAGRGGCCSTRGSAPAPP